MHKVLPITNPCNGEKVPGVWPESSFSVAIHKPTAQSAAKRLVYNIHFKTGNGKNFIGSDILISATSPKIYHFY